jgi:uncharacterized DUF497 family protein
MADIHGNEIHLGSGKSATQRTGPWHLVRDGREVFADPNHVVTENYRFEDEGEQRYLAVGMARNLVLVVCVFVDRSGPGVDVIHIISARKAVAYEQSIYEQKID